MDDTTKAVFSLIGGVVTAAAAAIWRLLQRRDSRQEKAHDWKAQADNVVYQRLREQLDGCHKRIRELEADVQRTENDRDAGWDLARAWHAKASEVHWEARTLCRAIRAEDGQPRIEFPPLPSFREILPRKDAR